MSTDPPLRSRGVASGRFWRNVTLIGLGHVALIAVLIRWSSEARSVPDAQSLVWLSGADDPAAERSEASPPAPTKASAPAVESEGLKPDQAEKERPSLTQTKSEIELPTPQPAFTPKPAVVHATNVQPTPKTMKKTVLAKTAKSPAHPKSSSAKSRQEETDASNEKKKNTKTARVKAKPLSNSGSGKPGSASKGASGGGGSNASEFGWYGNMLHDRFYSAWIQPTTTVASGTKISTLVKVRIDKDGHVSGFEIIKPSENVIVNESVAAIAKRVAEVDSPPTGLIKGDHYDVKINFELNTTRETAR